MINKKQKKIRFPDNFWSIKRPDVTSKDAFRDIIPINWNKNELKDVIIYSAKEKNDVLFSGKQH